MKNELMDKGKGAKGKGKEAMEAEGKHDSATLEGRIKYLRRIFAVKKKKMEKVVKKMVKDMEHGLSSNNADMKMLNSHFDPSKIYSVASSVKRVYALDLGGTNARALCVMIDQEKKDTKELGEVVSKTVSETLKKGSLPELFGFLAGLVAELIETEEAAGGLVKKELGFCFSFPTTNTAINAATLTNWTKEFKVTAADGKDLVQELQKSLDEKSPVTVTVTALVNDTVGSLAIGHFNDEKCVAGVIFGTGTNAAYIEDTANISTKKKEDIANITKPKHQSQASHKTVINTEWGNFNPPKGILTEYDIQDTSSAQSANKQVFEKMISGKYLGQIVGKVILELVTEYSLFKEKPQLEKEGKEEEDNKKKKKEKEKEKDKKKEKEKDKKKQQQEQLDAYKNLGTDKVNDMHNDPYRAAEVFQVAPLCSKESKVVRLVCKLVVKRAGRLSAAAIVAILTKLQMLPMKEKYDKKRYPVKIAVDGTMYEKYGKFRKYLMEGLEELLGENFNEIVILTKVKDGSGVGTAIIAACAT